MGRKRKTIDVADLVDIANRQLQHSTTCEQSRRGVISLLEASLHNANKYNGYRNLGIDEVPMGHLPGKREGRYPEAYVNVDDTRRQYNKK